MNQTQRRGFSGLQVLAFVALGAVVATGVTWWVVRTYVFPSEFEPVRLSLQEQNLLDSKLRVIGFEPGPGVERHARAGSPRVESGPPLRERLDQPLEPEPYFEDPSKREIGLSERELNGLLANNTDLATRLAIDLSDDLASAKLLIPMDPDFPILGGRILRVNAGLELEYADGRPVVKLRGVSLMGVPLPNAWLGNLKNVDLVEQYGTGDAGFWKAFADGVEFVQVREGALEIKLKE